MKPIRILLVDDHHLVRAGICALLREVADFTVVGDVGSGEESVRLAAELLPDVTVMDIAMPGVTGLQALERIRERDPQAKVVILSVHGTEEHASTALRLGACGYVLKRGAPHELELAIRAAVNNEIWLSPAISREVVAAYIARVGGLDRHKSILTSRQHEVLKLIAEGRRTKEIAFSLGISVKTVETYRAQLMNKLGVDDIAGLVRYAILQGIAEL
ncbi:MAG: response regulator transcription factor [Betaproteobacteria bacterium]|nr:response regulator transcription factor [Betaproteobacteria bacterium]